MRLCEAAYLSLLIVYSTGCPWYLLATMCLSCYDLLGKKEEKYWEVKQKTDMLHVIWWILPELSPVVTLF